MIKRELVKISEIWNIVNSISLSHLSWCFEMLILWFIFAFFSYNIQRIRWSDFSGCGRIYLLRDLWSFFPSRHSFIGWVYMTVALVFVQLISYVQCHVMKTVRHSPALARKSKRKTNSSFIFVKFAASLYSSQQDRSPEWAVKMQMSDVDDIQPLTYMLFFMVEVWNRILVQ